jgi:hypothetical protein
MKLNLKKKVFFLFRNTHRVSFASPMSLLKEVGILLSDHLFTISPSIIEGNTANGKYGIFNKPG